MPFIVYSLLVLWALAVVDVLRADDTRCRLMPRVSWLIIVACLPTVGGLAWLVAGRPWGLPGAVRPGPDTVVIDPWEQAEYQRRCRARAEAQRAAARRSADD